MKNSISKDLRFILILPLFLLCVVGAFAQGMVVRGTVVDESNQGLPGVTVLVKGTTTGAATGLDGEFTINVPSGNAVLVVSYVGFQTQEIAVNNRATINITMATDSKVLDEVVVVGYGTVKRRDLTGSVYSVKSDEIVQIPTHSPIEAIQGRVPGADITRGSGAPGSNPTITLRGNRSIAGRDDLASRNAPLYIIDGFQGGNINDLNPNDIESIEVLKDASATAIYGAMGANGVIIVTTKKGAEGKARVSYDGYYGVTQYNFPKSRTGQDYIQLRREAARTIGLWNSEADDARIFDGPGEWDAVQAGQWVDWLDLVKENGTQQNHALTVRAGTEKTKVFASAGYFREEGMLRNSDFTRYNLRLNLDQQLSSWAKVGVLSQVTQSQQNQRRNPLSQALTISPLGVPYNEDGSIRQFPLPDGTTISPLADERTDFIARNNTLRTSVLANAFVELTPLKGLSFRSSFGTNIALSRQGIFDDATSINRANTRVSQASSETRYGRNLNWDNVLSYTRDFGGHNVTITGITSYIQSDEDRLFAQGQGQLVASQLYYGLDATNTATTRPISSPFIGSKNLAYAGRLNYNYKSRYLLTVTGRYDGASRLAPGNKWDFFPSVALGWNISEEAFMQGVEQVTNLKLRASYGVAGNYSISPYGTQSLLVANQRYMGFGEIAAPAYYFSELVGNPNLGWEKSATTNFGFDLGLFNNRIAAIVDVYDTKTTDILYPRTLPTSTGVTRVNENIAATRNRGIEVALTTHNIQTNDFSWSTTFSFTRNKEEITELIDGTDIITNETTSLLIGRPVSSFYTYKLLGIWQANEADEAARYSVGNYQFQPGDIKVADLNGDFIINADDLGYIGSTVPQWLGGIQNNFKYKAFDLGVYLFARFGQTINAEFLGRFNPSGTGNGPEIANYWTPENPSNDFPRPRRGSSLNNYVGYTGYQALNFVDGSYFKIRNVTLGYTLPKTISQRVKLENLRVYATASNPLVVSRHHLLRNYDPEGGGSESNPLSRQIVFGVNVGF
ncbi:TonB-dependent receptor [Pontibacter qinzhouensis]|uniref:TonB-dependent receptor n=1 Tax=Pontibacter qinzhouensis TaxID=2603253 RepID=A0A5C8KA40_9BACT|nr:TonB-dependent receptor [Pontibacter qinzhouensis]